MSVVRQRLAQSGDVPVAVWVGFSLAGGFVALATLIVVGSALSDPGGQVGLVVGLGIVAPQLVLARWALVSPDRGAVALGVAAIAPIGFGVWTLVDYDAAWSWENANGPLGLVLTVIVAGPAVVLGLTRPRAAGVLLLGVTLLPAVSASLGAALAGSSPWNPLSVAVLTAPVIAGGVLYVREGLTSPRASRGPRRTTGRPDGPGP